MNAELNCSVTNLTYVKDEYIYTAMVSSIASIIGSGLIIITFAIWADIRTSARAILVFLAIADLLTAIGYLFASILFKVNNVGHYDDNMYILPQLCKLQSFITTAFPISSFLWTANLAIYLFVSITINKARVAKKMIILFHITAWGIPLLLCIPGAITGVLGRKNNTLGETQGTVGWCWVSFDNSYDVNTTNEEVVYTLNRLHVLELVYGKFWEISVFILAIILCIAVKISIYKKKKEAEKTNLVYGSLNADKVHAALTQLDQKLIWIPIVFILFRGWGTARWLIAIIYPECYNIDRNCSLLFESVWFPNDCLDVLYHPILMYMQAIGDPGQGWANALLYVFFHPIIARRLFPCVFVCCGKVCKGAKKILRRKGYDNVDGCAMSYSVTENTDSAAVEIVNAKKSSNGSEYQYLIDDSKSDMPKKAI